jgi:hypothetical protein
MFLSPRDKRAAAAAAAREAQKMEFASSSCRDWRSDIPRYKRDEVFLDIAETVEFLLSATGGVLQSSIKGIVRCSNSPIRFDVDNSGPQ